MQFLGLILVFTIFISINAYIVDPGPRYPPTVGQIWPKPQAEVRSNEYLSIDPLNFIIETKLFNCDILENAVTRYMNLITNITTQNLNVHSRHSGSYESYENEIPRVKMERIRLDLLEKCETTPYLNMDESYSIDTLAKLIKAKTIWGMLRGLESFSQLITSDGNRILQVPVTKIDDYPRFSHRGLLVDTSRHFLHVTVLLSILDAMSYNKLNVFHWHIVDDQSFPYMSKKYPDLATKGAYAKDWWYTQKDVKDIIEAARMRGIRVIPEFDVPGHTRSWGVAYPFLLTPCEGKYAGKLGPMNPIKRSTYNFLESFFNEINKVFPDKYLHVGGDEVGYECWDSNREINAYVKKNSLSYQELEGEFNENVANMVDKIGNNPIVWQEVVQNYIGIKLPSETIVQVWKPQWRMLVIELTLLKYNVLLSSCWYLDYLHTGGDWIQFYDCEPLSFIGTNQQKELIIGGEACMWAESINDANVISRIFPRASATAERLWSSKECTNSTEAAYRLEEHTCRMISRGITAQPPNGPGFC